MSRTVSPAIVCCADMPAACICAVPWAIYAHGRLELTITAAALSWVGGIIGIAATLAIMIFAYQGIMAPVIRQAATLAGPAAAPERVVVSMRALLQGAIFTTTAFAALITGAAVPEACR